jgi:ABC-2 type transport system ATP-binding protein
VQALTDREVRREDATTIGMTVPEGESLLPTAIRRLDAAGIVVRTATGVPPTLDDVFLALTGRTLREAGEGTADASESDAATGAENDKTGVLS